MKKGFWFRSGRVLLVLLAALGIAAALVVMRPRAERQERVDNGRLVEVLPVRSASLEMLVEGYGTVQPREMLKLVAEVRGQVVALHAAFTAGGFARRGTPLITIDPRTYALEVERRRVQVRQAEAELARLEQESANLASTRKIAAADRELAETDFMRLTELARRQVVAQTTRDKAEQNYLMSVERLQAIDNQIALLGPRRRQLDAQHEMAEVTLRQARLDLEKTVLRAPFDAWVLEKAVEAGQLVNSGQQLGRIYRSGALDVEVSLPAEELRWMPADLVRGAEPAAEIIFAGESGETRNWSGRVARIKAQVDDRTRTYALVVEVDDAEDGNGTATGGRMRTAVLRPGMFVTVRIQGIELENVFRVPRYVVHTDDVVYVADGDRLQVRSVEVLRRFKDHVYIGRGLSDGERVVRTPLSQAADGMLLRIKE